MNHSLNLSEVIACVKSIVDSVRCTICDKAEGGRSRYPCGHTVCDGCLTAAEGCMLCLTPPSTLAKPVIDTLSSNRAENACSLLKIFQNTFNIDVYRRSRISEQLKAEKELFPDCIQAPVKYSNKRKRLSSTNNKENLGNFFYPGENIPQPDSYKMNNCNNYVQQWLNSSKKHPRKVLADLKANNQEYKKENIVLRSVINTNDTKQTAIKNQQSNITKNKNKKRSNFNNSPSLLDICIESGLNIKKMKSDNVNNHKNDNYLKENDESGIVLDDEPILIDDSQSQFPDKDALALLAVRAADKEEDLDAISHLQSFKVIPHEENNKNVSYLKKSDLSTCCFDCKNKNSDETAAISSSKNVSITIESNSFVATIKITNLEENTSKNSVHVQTEISEALEGKVHETNNTFSSDHTLKEDIENQYVLESESKMRKIEIKQDVIKSRLHSPNIFELYEDLPCKRKSVTIEESDSDEGCGDSFLHVTADVHRSCDPVDYGILGEIDTTELIGRSRKIVRGVTPDSNNSSDKENCDPNKSKKRKHSKKYMFKK